MDVRVPRMAEQVIEASHISSQSRVLESTIGQTLDVPETEMAEQLVEALKNASPGQNQAAGLWSIPVTSQFRKL